MADERKIPDSAIDAGGRTDNVSADAINHNGINATENNDAPTESREEQAKRLKEKKQASFEYADNYRQKLKKEAEERRMTPAQMRKKAEKEAAIAREKAEREAAIRQAIEREKEEAKERAERAEALRDQVEKSLAEKKAQEEAEKEALERAYEEQTEQTAPAPEEIPEPEKAEALDEEPADETYDSAEDDDIEDAEEYADDSDEEEDEYDDYEEDDGLDGFTFDFDENDEDMTFTFGYGDDDGDEEEEEPDNDMILTFDTDDIIYNYEKQPKKKAAQRPAEPEEGEKAVAEPHPTVEEPVQATNKDTAQKPAVPVKKKKKAVSAPAPKKAVAMSKPAAKKRASRPAEVKAVPTVIPAAEPAPTSVIDDRIAELLEENKQLLRENIDELRRKQAELEQRQAALESATPAQIDADNTATPAEVSTPESSDVTVIDEDDAKPATYVPEPEVVKPSSVIKESGPVRAAERSEIKKIEEIPESELILNYAAGDAAENINSAAAVYGLTSLPPVSLRKKIRDNDRLSRKLERKLRKEKKDYRRAKTKEEKLEHIADCAEYQRAILDFDAESLAAAALLGNDYTTRKKHLRRDVGEYNAFAQKLEDMSTTQIPQAPATMPDDVILGNPYKRLPAVTTANLADNDANDPGAARNKDASPMSYVSQLDNDDDSITGISGRPAGAKGAKKKHALVKGEVKKGAKELRQKMRSNGKLLKENRKDLRNELEAANKSGFAEKTEHMVSGLNYQREIIAVLGDSYEAAVRTHDKAEAKRISRQIDKEVGAYNKLGRAVEKRTGEPIPAAFNTFAKDIADNREMKLPPVVKYGQATTEGSFTDSEDVLVIKRVEFAEEEGSAKVLQVGSRKGRKEEELPTVTVIDEPVSGISVTPPSEPVTVTPLTPPAQTITLSSDKKSYELKDVVTSPTTPSTQTAVYIEPIIIGHPIESPKVDVPLRPMSERIVETADSAKRIGSKYTDGSLGTITVSQADSTPTSRISEKKPAKMRESDKAEKAKEKVVYTLVEDTDHVKVFKADPTLRVAPRYDKVPFEDREVQVIKLKHVAEEPDSAKVIKANVPGVVPEEESFDFIPLVEGAEAVTNEQAQAEETEVEAKEVMAERDFEPVVFRSSGESGSDEIGKKKLRKEASEKQEEQENEISDASEAQAETLTEEITEEPVADGAVLGELTEEPVSEEVTEETKAEEEVIEETVEEPKAEEPAHEEAVEESETEEPVAEEATEELATEEATEEPSAEEAVVEETAEESKAEETVVEEVAEESEQELPALVNYNKEENLAAEQEKEQETERHEAERTVGEQPDSAKVFDAVIAEPEEKKVVAEKADSAKILEAIEIEPTEQKVISEEADSAKVFDAITVEAPEEEECVVSEAADSAKVLDGTVGESKEEKTISEEADSAKILEGTEPEAEEHKVVVIDDESAKVLEGTVGKEQRTVTEETDSAKVFDAVQDESRQKKVVSELPDSAKIFEAVRIPERKVSEIEGSAKVFEAKPDVTRKVSEAENSAKVMEKNESVVPKAAGAYEIVEESAASEASEATVESPVAESDEIVHIGDEVVTVLEDTVAETEEIKEEKAPETATKGYILTENSNETKTVRGKSRVYTLTEVPDSAKRFEASAPTEIRKSGYSITEDHESAKVFSATVGIKREVVEDASATKVIAATESEPVTVRIVTENDGTEKKFDATVIEGEERIVFEDAESAKVLEATQAEETEARVVLEKIDSAEIIEAAEQIPTEHKTVSEKPESAKTVEAVQQKSKASTGYVITVDPKSAKTIEGRPELKYTVVTDEFGRKTVTATPSREEADGKYTVTEEKQTADIEETTAAELDFTESERVAESEQPVAYTSLTAISELVDTKEQTAEESDNAVTEVAEITEVTAETNANEEPEGEPQLMPVEFDGTIPEIIEERVTDGGETATEAEDISVTVSTESESEQPVVNSRESEDVIPETEGVTQSEPEEHTVTVVDVEEAHAVSAEKETAEKATPDGVKTVSEIPDSAKVLLGKVKRTVEEDHEAIKIIQGTPARVVSIDTEATKIISAAEGAQSKSGAYVIKQQQRTPDGKLVSEDVNDVLSVEGESVEVGDEAKSYEYKLDDVDIDVPEDFELSESAPDNAHGEETVTEIVDEAKSATQSDGDTAEEIKVDDGVLTIAYKPTYVITESTRTEADGNEKADIPLESFVTSRYTIQEHLPEAKPVEDLAEENTAEAEAEVIAEKPEGSYVIKQYAPMRSAKEQADAEAEAKAEQENARRPEEIIIYGKSAKQTPAEQTETVESRELSAPKAKGAYTLLESSKVKSAVEDTAAIDNDIVHVGEETVELIEETFPENYVTLTSDTVADEIKPEKTVEKASDTIVVNEDVTSVPQVVENADAAKVIPAASDTDKTADGYSGYVITEDSAQAKRFEATARGYTLTEEPDSAKRFEASEPVEIENGKYVITVLPESAKTVEGRPELKYTVAVDEDGKKTVKADIADESKAGEYRIVEDKDGIRVLSGVEKTEKHIVENAREISEIKDTSTFVKAEDAPVYEAEHTAEVLEEPVSENYVTLTSDTVFEETKPEKTAEKLADTIVVNEKPASKGYSIEIDEDAKRTISARENAADSKDVHYGVAEQDSSAKVIPSFTIINAPKSRDAYVITEDKSGLKTIGSTSESAHGKPEIRETEGKVIGAKAEAVHGKPEIHETDGKIIGAAETQKARVVCESPEDAKVITLARETGYEIGVRPEDAHVIGEVQAQRVVSEVENPKELLKNNKVLNTKKSQNNYAILESRDTKVVYAAEQETAEEQNAQPIGGVYTLGIEEGKIISAAESTEVAPQQTYRISTDEEHRKILEAIEILKRANYDVSEIERAENMIQAAKVLNTKSEDNSYAIVESRDVKVVSAAESAIEKVDENPTVLERAGSERVISAAAETEQSGGYEIRETAQEPKATEARVINASKSRDSYVILEKRGTEKVIEEAPISEDTAERAPEYFVSEKLGTEKTVHGTETAPESAYAVREAYSTGIIIPEGTKILNAEKGGDRYIIAEHRGAAPTDTVQGDSNIPVSHSFDISEKSGTERIIHKAAPDEEQITASDGYRISESGNPYVVTQRKLNRHGKPMVYEVGGAHVVGARKQLHERKDPTVFEQSGTEKIISKKDFKLPAKPLVYEEIGTQKIVRPEASIRNTVKDCIVEYKGTEMVVKGNIPIVDVLIDPYKNVNMGVLAINDLKKYLSDNDKEIAKLKYHFRYAKKQKAESEKSADKIMSHIAMINYQCLICERYVERISVCNNAESRYYAEKGAAMLKDELKKYNDLITEYNVTTSSKIPLADKTLPKRVLAGEAYEHLTRISYKLINEQAPMKTSKKFNKKKKGSDKPAAKIIEQKRYLADIKLIERCDDESANDVLMVQNRYDFESALLKGERDMMNFKFAKRSKKNAARKLYINRKLKALKKAKAKAVRYEALDNERYYRVLSCDTSLESYKNDNNKKKKVTKIVTEVGKLLKERDDINSKLNMMYAGTLADISGAGDGEKWRSVKAASAKKHSRKLRGKANALKNSVPGFGEKKAERVHMFNSLLDAKVEAQSTIDLCKYRLKREKNKFADKMSIRKDIREARKRIRLIDREIKERRKLILEEHYGPDASFELTALVGMCVLGAIGVVWLAKTAGIDIIGTVKPYVQQWIDSIGAASPAIKSVVDMIKGYLM